MAKVQQTARAHSPKRSPALQQRRWQWLSTVSAAAAGLGILLSPQSAMANGTNANVTVQFGANPVVQRDATTDAVTITSNQALVDWTMTDPDVFLPAGNGLIFRSDNNNYTVLNRIFSADPTRPIAINGTVLSLIGTNFGGNVWFYNPGGILAGPTSQFVVGSLLLTSNEIQVDLATQSLFGPGNTIRFRGSPDSTSSVIVDAGARILLPAEGSYLALVAPRVEQRSGITAGVANVAVNGSVAYVAAEQLNMRINNGLFDIDVLVGTTDTQGVVHSGLTTGPARNPVGGATPNPDNHGIYMVAVPKNDALTMLVSGVGGYTAAANVTQADGRIILSAGYDIANGEVDVASGGTTRGNIDIRDFGAFDDVTGFSTGDTTLTVDATNDIVALEDMTLSSQGQMRVAASAVGLMAVQGNLSLQSGTRNTGNHVTVNVSSGARFLIGGDFTADASGVGALATVPGDPFSFIPGSNGQDATGGAINVAVDSARFEVGGTTNLRADAQAGVGALSYGVETAGTVDLSMTGASATMTLGALNLSATGLGGRGGPGQPLTGNKSGAGQANLQISGGALTADGVTLSAESIAPSGSNSPAGLEVGVGGTVSASFTGGTHSLGALSLSTASGVITGSAQAGSASLTVDNATVNVTGQLDLDSSMIGNQVGAPGNVALNVRNTGVLTANTLSVLGRVDSNSANARGSNAQILIDNGSATFDTMFLTLSGFAESSVLATGGNLDMDILNAGSLTVTSLADIDSNALGGLTSTGGLINIDVNNGAFATDTLFLGNSGIGNPNGVGVGGTTVFNLTGVDGRFNFESMFSTTDGRLDNDSESGGRPADGLGGSGRGGSATFNFSGGQVNGGSMQISAAGQGGDGGIIAPTPTNPVGSLGNGGLGTGGTATVNLLGSTVSVTDLNVSAKGSGGRGSSYDSVNDIAAGTGGTGRGGVATINARAGQLTATNVTVDAGANDPVSSVFGSFGSDGGFGSTNRGGAGGAGIGGTAVFVQNGATSTIGALTVSSATAGGDGGDSFGGLGGGGGGAATGGTARLEQRAGTLDATSITVNAGATGGRGGDAFPNFVASSFVPSGTGGVGGAATGGTASVDFLRALDDATGTPQPYTVRSNAVGGRGGEGLIGASGGTALGGTARIQVNNFTVSLANPVIEANGTGGASGASAVSNPAAAGANGRGGTALIDVQGAAGVLNLNGLTLNSTGTGQAGANGAQAADDVLDGGDGGDGGDGQGGLARIVARLGGTVNLISSGALTVNVAGQGGLGGSGGRPAAFTAGRSGDAGDGGNGDGGRIQFTANGGTLNLGSVVVNAGGTGGNGGGGPGIFDGEIIQTNGGAGGTGTGGDIAISAVTTTSRVNITEFAATAIGQGGTGSNGVLDSFGLGIAGANGGAGGDGLGGTISLSAGDGRLVIANTSPVQLTAEGRGGLGGNGTNGDSNSTPGGAGGAGGNGGNGGSATGGGVDLSAGNGLLQAGNVSIGVNGIAREGGNPGGGGAGGPGVFTSFPGIPPGAPGLSGNFGTFGTGTGGVSQITVENGEAGGSGTIQLGQTNILANGRTDTSFGSFTGFGGQININDGLDLGTLSFAGLNLQSQGTRLTGFESINILSSGNPIVVTNDLVADAGADITFGVDNSGGVDVGGDIRLTSAQFITMRYSGCVAEICSGDPILRAGGRIDATAGGNFSLQGAFVLGATLDLIVRAEGGVFSDLGSKFVAPRLLDISARGDVTVRNADANVILIEAGVVRTPVAGGGVIRDYSDALLTLGEDVVPGLINSRGRIDLNSGGSINVLADTQLTAGQSINLISGNDILIGSNASLLSNDAPMDPASDFYDPGNVIVNAGGIPSTLGSGSFVTSIIMQDGASIMAQGAQLRLSANAIDAGNASLAGQALFADVFNAPPNGTSQSDDDGQLSANCLEGDICIGALAFVDSVNIGQSGVPIRFTGPGDISANVVRITTRRGMTMGTLNVDTSITGANEVTLQSLEGDISLLQGLNIQGNVIRITANQGSLLGGGSLASPGDIGITVGADISAATIDTGGQLTQVADIGGALESSYAVPGNIVVANYIQGAAGQFEVQAGGNIDFGSITVPGQDVRLFAGPNVRLGTNSGTQNLVMSAGSVFYGALVADQTIDLQALAGGITGNDATAGGDLLMDAQGADINVVNLSAGGSTRLTSNANINFGSSTSTSGSLTISGLDIGGGAVSAGTFVDVTSTSIGLGNVTANAGTVSVIGSVGAVQTGDVSATGDVTLNARGNLGLGAVQSGGAVALQSQTSGLSSGNLTGGSINASAAGAVVTGVVIANTGGSAPHDVVINAGTTLDYTSITAADAVQLSGTAISGGGVQAGLGVDIGGTALNLGAVSALGGPASLRASTGNIVAGAVNATGGITISALLGTIQTDALNAGALLDIDAGGAIGFTTASGTNGVTIDSNGAISFTSASSSNGGVTINGAGGVTGTSIASQGDAIVTASAGGVTLAQLTSNALARVTGQSVSLGATQTAGNLTIGASAGAINGTGAWTVGGAANLSSSAATTLTTLAATGNVTANAGTGFGYQTLSGNAVSITAGGAIAGQGITATGALTLDGGSIAVGALQSTGVMGLTADTTLRFTTANTGGAFTATADDLGFTGVRAAGNIGLNARLTNGGNVVSTGGAIALALTGDATLANVSAANALTGSITNLNYTALNGTNGGVNLTGGSFTGGQVTGAGVSLDGTTLNLGGVQSTAGITLRSTGVTRFTGASAATNVTLTADDLGFTSILAGGNVALNARAVSGGNVTATNGDIALALTGNAILADVLAGNAITGTFADLTYGTLTGTNGGVTLTGGALTGGAVSGAGIALTGSSLDLGALASSVGIVLQSSGATQFTTASATNGFSATASDLAFASINAGTDVSLDASTVTGGNVTATSGTITLALTGSATLADLLAGSGITGSFGNFNYSTLTATGGDIALTGGALTGGNVSGASIDLTGSTLALGALASPGNMALRSTGATSFTGAQADGDVTVNAAALDFDHVIAAGAIALNGSTVTGNVVRSTLQDATITGSGAVAIGAIEGSDVRVSAASFTSADIQARGLLSVTASSGTGTQWQAGGAMDLNITGALNVTRLIAGGTAQIVADSYAGTSLTSSGDMTVTVRALNAGSISSTDGAVSFASQGGIVGAVSGAAGLTGNAGALRFTSLTSSGGAIALTGTTLNGGAVTAAGGVSLDGTALTLGNVRAGGLAELTSSGAITANQVTGQSISIDSATSYTGAAMTSTGGPLAVAAGTSISTGALNAAGNANLTAGTSLTTGTIIARDLTASAETVLTLGDVTAQVATLRGADIVLSRVSGSALDIVADTSLSATSLASTGAIAFTAPSVTLGTVTATGQVTGNGTDIGFDSIVAGGISLTGQNVSGGLLQSVSGIDLQIPGLLAVDSVVAGSSVSGNLGTLRFGTMTADGDIDLQTANVEGGALSAGGLAQLISTGAINLTSANGGDVLFNAGSADITITGLAQAAGAASLIGGNLLLGDVVAGSSLDLLADNQLIASNLNGGSIGFAAGSADLGSATSGGSLTGLAGAIRFNVLDASADIDLAAGSISGGSLNAGAGINLVSTGDLTIGDARSFGTLALLGGGVQAGNLVSDADINVESGSTITTGDITAALGSVLITNGLGTITTGVITAANDFTLDTGSDLIFAGVNVGDDIRISSAGSMDIGHLEARGTGTDSEGDGSRIVLSSGGAMLVSHAESVDGFTADAARFETGLNTIITGGDIIINTSGDSLLGNSQAGGLIRVTAGGLIDFNNITSGGLTSLSAATTITGVSSTAGGSFDANAGGNLGIGTIAATGGLFASSGGALTLGNATSGGDAQLRTTGAGTLAVTSIQAAGNVVANANAAASIGTANATNGNIYVIATGPATLNSANAGVMIGVSGAGVSGSGAWNAGEDILVLSSGTANLGALSAGDDVDVIAPGAIALASGTARGTARDDRALQLSTITTGPQFVIVSAAPDGADVRLTSSGGGISAGVLDAGDDVIVNAANAVALSGIARTRGLGTTGGASNIAVTGSDVTMAGSQAFTDLLVTASGQMALGNAQAGGRVQAISSGGSASFASLQAGSSALVQAAGAINGGAATTGTGLTLDGASVTLTGNAQASGAANLTARSGAINAANVGGASITANASTSFAGGALTTSSGDLAVTSGTGLSTGAINAAGVANLNAGGDLSAGIIAASALNGIAGGAINLGNASIINAASLNGNSVALGSVNTGTTLNIVSATSLSATGLTSGGNMAVNAATINPGSMASGGSIAANGGTLTASALSAAGDIALALSGPVAVTTFNANGAITGNTGALSFDSMTSGGAIDLSAASVTGGAVDAGGTARFATIGAQTFATLLAGGDVTLNASNGAIAVTSNIATPGAVTAIGNAVTLNASGPLTVQQATANAGNVGITAAQNLVVRNASASGNIALTSTGGGVTAGVLSAIDIILRAATGIALTGNVVASDELDMTAGGLIDISALASGASITARSADIELGSTARLGQNGSTQSVALINNGAGAMTLGGSAAAAGYRLTNAEAARITSNGNLRFDAGNPAGVANALVVQDLSLNAAATSGQIGANGAVDFVTGGNVLVNGALALNNAEGNDLRIVAGNDLVVDAGTGSVRLIEGSGRGGSLGLAADRIAVVTSQALTDITGQPVDAIDLRLASNDGVSDGRTTLEAFEIFASADSGLFIQNTASIDDLDARTGFVANRFDIETRGGASTGIAINGVIFDGAGLPITGIDTIGLVTIADPTGGLAFDSLSTINGCLIANPVGCLPLEELFNSQLRDFIEEEVEDQKKKGTKPRDMAFMLLGNMLIEVKDFERFGYQPPIDEPVTGAGNDDLWVPVP